MWLTSHSLQPLDINDEESIEDLLLQIDMAIQVRACLVAAEGASGSSIASLLPHRPAVPANLPSPLLLCVQYGEDQEVKAQELGDMYDPEGDE